MPIKFTKPMTTHLMKYVRKVNVTFNPLDKRSAAAREVWSQLQAGRFTKANPKFSVNAIVTDTFKPPMVQFEFVDDSEMDFPSGDYDCKEMLFEVYLKAMQMDTEYELEGKNIDDLM